MPWTEDELKTAFRDYASCPDAEAEKWAKITWQVLNRTLTTPDHAATISSVIDAWEALPGGRNYSPREIENWLRDHMTPAIDMARGVIGRKRPG